MKKKQLLCLLLAGIIWTAFGCKAQENDGQESREESHIQESQAEESKMETIFRVPEDWNGPEIFRCRTPQAWMQGKKTDQAVHLLGRDFLESRMQKGATEKYGYSIESYESYTVIKVLETSSLEFYGDKDLRDLEVQMDGKTWVVGYSAVITKSKWEKLPKNGGPEPQKAEFVKEDEKETRGWNLGDWWILHREGDVYSMMSYMDYRCVRETNQASGEDLFAAYSVSEKDIPEVRFWDYEGRPYWTDEVRYFEALQTYLHNDTILFEHGAEAEEDIEKVILELGKQYLDELCSKEYDPNREGKEIRQSAYYYVKEYKDLSIQSQERSLDRTVEKLAEKSHDPIGFKTSYHHSPADCFLLSDYGRGTYLKAGENIWLVSFKAEVKSDDPVWGQVQLDSGEVLPPGQGFEQNNDAGIKLEEFIVVQEGSQYFMVSAADIVMKSEVRHE